MIATPIDRLQARTDALPALFTYGFRPFFLGAAGLAAIAVPAWLMMLATGFEPLGPVSGLAWHAHEMIFGYVAAVMAGFVLTAVPNWTGRLPVTGWPLLGLFSLWGAGRLAMVALPLPVTAAVIDMAFLLALAAVVGREIIAGRNFRNLPIAGLIAVFAAANLLFHLGAVWPSLAGYGERLALGVTAVLIGLIGGRITPSFTRNWMAKAGLEPLPAPFGLLDKAAVLATIVAAALWVGWPEWAVTGVALLAAAALLLLRLSRWRGLAALVEPIVVVLHLGYLWLAVSLLLLGLAALAMPAVEPTSALHALTAGAIGTMTLAVMTRASLGHTGRPIVCGPATLAIYGLVTAGAALRAAAAPLLPEAYLTMLVVGGGLWSAAFALFAVAYGPLLLRPGLGRT